MEQITSRKNPYIKKLALSKKNTSASPILIIEGMKMIREAIASEIVPNAILFIELEDIQELLTFFQAHRVRLIQVTQEIIHLISNTKTPQGAVAVIDKRPLMPFNGAKLKRDGLYVILEDVSDPGNVGTILRTCEAFGVDGVVLCGQCADLYNEKTMRATMGAVFRMPVWKQDNIKDVLLVLKENQIKGYGAALGDNCIYLGEPELNFKQGCAIMIGNEARGLSHVAKEGCGAMIKIPMSNATESLNAAVACAVILWEAYRNRH